MNSLIVYLSLARVYRLVLTVHHKDFIHILFFALSA
jgi:hypothetical protein